MSSSVAMGVATATAKDPERRHRILIVISSLASIGLIAALTIYGADYYLLSMAERPHSPKHVLLRPSGSIGIRLGMLGVLLFLGIYLYYFRKRWKWLSRIGSSRHWLDFHVVMGLTAPVIIAFHAAFKFRGMAGMAFWIMAAVALSGVIGRYLYAQIPRTLNAAELSWQELEAERIKFEEKLSDNQQLTSDSLRAALPLPSPDQIAQMSIYKAIGFMMVFDLTRPFRVARLRRQELTVFGCFRTLGGLLRSSNSDLESTIELVRKQSALHKKMLFLSKSQQVFHLWHIVHRPFSYAFVVLGSIHIATVILLGYF
jgi:TRAP-type C4-dicarboxylate transport system permease small subunit